MDHLKRIEKLKKKGMLDKGDCAIISHGTNFYYYTKLKVTGTFERLFLLVLCIDSNDFIIAPKLYENELVESKINVFLWSDDENPYEKLKKLLNYENKTFLIDDTLPAGTFLKISEILKSNRFLPLSPVTEKIRMLKDSEEIGYIKKAVSIVDNVFDKISNENIKGLTEIEL